MSELTLDVIGRTIFGLNLRAEAQDMAQALNTVLEGFARGIGPLASLSRVPTAQRRREIQAIEELDAIVRQMIAQRTRDIGDGYVGGDLLTMMLIDRRCRRSVLHRRGSARRGHDIGPAGHETTALTLTWAWHLLATNPQWRAWLTEEVDALAEPLDGRPFTPATAHLCRGRGVDAPAPGVDHRALARHRPAGGGWDLPRGSVVLASQYAMHRDPRFWSDAHAFRPDRWLTGEGTFDERAPRVPRGVWFPVRPGPVGVSVNTSPGRRLSCCWRPWPADGNSTSRYRPTLP